MRSIALAILSLALGACASQGRPPPLTLSSPAFTPGECLVQHYHSRRITPCGPHSGVPTSHPNGPSKRLKITEADRPA
jgi:hypothetical protein